MRYPLVAKKAMKQYAIKPKKVEFLLEETNVFYLVKTESEKYVLKIYKEATSNMNDNLAEHFLIEVLLERTNIITPKMVENLEGLTVTRVPYNNKRGYKRVALYHYETGKRVVGNEDSQYFYHIGKTIAKMHLATKELVFPEHVNPKRWDSIFYKENQAPVYKDPKYKKYITEEMIEILDKLIEHINNRLVLFYDKGTPQLIHGDLNPWNIKVRDDSFVIYDFEEVMLAYPIHDIAAFMYYNQFREDITFFEIKNTFMSGYRSVSNIPQIDDKDFELIMMAKRINLFNYVLANKKDPAEFIELSFEKIKEYYISYK